MFEGRTTLTVPLGSRTGEESGGRGDPRCDRPLTSVRDLSKAPLEDILCYRLEHGKERRKRMKNAFSGPARAWSECARH